MLKSPFARAAFWLSSAFLVGCNIPTPVAEFSGVSNGFGVPFANRSGLLNAIPQGTSEHTAEATMRAHGLERVTSVECATALTDTFHVPAWTLSRLLFGDLWVIMYFEEGQLIDAQVGTPGQDTTHSPWDD